MSRTLCSILYFLMIVMCYSEEKKKILILHSYSEDYLWTKQVHNGIFRGAEEKKDNYIFYVEYMDSKKFYTKEYLEKYSSGFTYKYSHEKIDLLIAVDDNALLYALENKEKLFKDVPILGTGLNSLNPEFLKLKDVYFMIEEPDYEENIKLALKQNPKATKIYFISDITTTGKNIRHEVELIAEKYPLEKYWLDNVTLEKLKNELSKVDENSIIMYFVFFVDKFGKTYTYDEPLKELVKTSPNPIYINWSFHLNLGAFGGYIYNGEELGVQTFNIAEDILKKKIVSNLISTKQKNEYIFDFNVIKNKSLEHNFYPKTSVFLNKPQTFYEKNKKIILIFLLILVFMIIILILVYLNLMKEKIINYKNEELLETQKELLYRLGNVIESRSKETANHVGRVAKLSKFIALEMGLTQEEAELIEIASPMHDVGKIGIEDIILNFPGKYTEEQFSNMKRHSKIGYDILKGSKKKIIETAAVIAYEHHERWDGKGYPRRLKEEEISIFARITMVADVIDALLSERTYKKPWSLETTFDYVIEQKGKMFDPEIVEIVEKNKEQIQKIIKEN